MLITYVAVNNKTATMLSFFFIALRVTVDSAFVAI
jgi:hypothetical protein